MDINNLPNNQNLNNSNGTANQGTSNSVPPIGLDPGLSTPVNNELNEASMANQEPSLMGTNQLNSTSLESMTLNGSSSLNDSTPATTPMMETLDLNQPSSQAEPAVASVQNPTPNPTPNMGSSSVNQPVPPMGSNPSVNTPDPFNAVPVPPVFSDNANNKNKKKTNKTTIVILLILLVVAIGGGLYYFLVLAKANTPSIQTVTITPKDDIYIGLNEEIPTNADYYATITGVDATTCTVNTENINNQEIGAYNYIITCGSFTELGRVAVEDNVAPEVILKDVEVLVGNTPSAADFIETCIDASTCTYEITTDLSTIINTIGEYDVNITISDIRNNTKEVVGKLIVTTTAADTYLTCTSEIINLDDIFATQVDKYTFGFANNVFHNAVKTSTFTFSEQSDYQNHVENYDPTKGINNIVGDTYYNPIAKSIYIKQNKTLEDLMSELNLSSSATDINILRANLMFNNFTCE